MKFLFLTCIVLLLQSCSNTPAGSSNEQYQKAKEAFDVQNYTQAVLQLDRVLDSNPENEAALFLKSRTFQLAGQGESALQTIGKLIAVNPNNHEALSFRAVMLSNQRQYQKAQADIKKAIVLTPENPDYQIELGINQQLQGQHEAATATFSDIISQFPENDNTYFLRGNSRQQLGKKIRALKDYNMAIRLNHLVPEFYSKRAFLLIERAQYDEAIDDFSKIIALAPQDNSEHKLAIAFNNRGYAKYKKGALRLAQNDIDHSLQLFPENSYAYRNRALVHLANNLVQDACADIQVGLQLGFSLKYGPELEEMQKRFCSQK